MSYLGYVISYMIAALSKREFKGIQWLSRATVAIGFQMTRRTQPQFKWNNFGRKTQMQSHKAMLWLHFQGVLTNIKLSPNHTGAFCFRHCFTQPEFFPICPKDVHRSYFSSSRMFLIYFSGSVSKPEELISCSVWGISILWGAKWELWVFSIS